MVVGGGVIGTPTGRFCLRLCWGGVCQTAWKWGENKKSTGLVCWFPARVHPQESGLALERGGGLLSRLSGP